MTLPPPPEWAPHEAVWIGFPSDADLWEDDLIPAQFEVAAFAKAVYAEGKGEAIWLVAGNDVAAAKARSLAPFATVIVERFGDIWLRDTGAIVTGTGADRRAQGFRFNGWGDKYDLAGDDSIGERLAVVAGLPYAKEAAHAKLFTTDMAMRHVSNALQIHGGNGYSRDYRIERIFRDVRLAQIYEGTNQIQRLIISRQVVKELA